MNVAPFQAVVTLTMLTQITPTVPIIPPTLTTNRIFFIVSEGSLGRLRVRGTYRGEQLQHILAVTQREENLLGARQQGESATDADPRESAARQPVAVRADTDAALGRAQADALPAAPAPRQAEAASAAAQKLPHTPPESEPEA